MRITLQIENVDRLETGGQVSYSCADRGFDIGRHEHLDWSLPDPERVVSGKHCEVRFEGGNFVLYDVSTNGTFLNGSSNRMDKAHALRSGDRIMIGDYIVKVTLDAEQAMSAGFSGAPTAEPPSQPAPWQTPQPSAPPVQEPQWPAAPPPGQPAYPAEEANNPWNTPTSGMEGRHAPPSQTPGIGTPADDVWSQQGHGWGSADPALYDPQSNAPQAEAARPAQADPLDHLAAQPSLQPHGQPTSPAQAPQAVPPQPQSFPPAQQEAADNQTAEPLFKMPDMAAEGVAASADGGAAPTASASSAPPAQSDGAVAAAEASPFPEAPAMEAAPAEIPQEIEAPSAEPPQAPVEPPVQPAPAVSEAPKPQSVESTAPAKEAVATNNETGKEFLKAFSEGAGIPDSVLADRDPEEFAREMGSILQGITSDLMGLLQARSKVKAMTRNANRTLISRSGNNALKFSPTPQTALQTMLAQNVEETGYLPLPKAMTAAFKDIQKHHVWTYAAMQKAAARFDETLSPKAIEEEGQVAKSTFGNQKAKLWERMQERWTSLSGAYDDGLVGVFTQYFTESYEEFSNDEPE
ncbi:type VI secretion system-associated FHA domain protein TagH [uncultured Roseibium sp.]|uniref:type VI secretion system-associated FHA domain protein TagH n=1 Tax=uncultured Roseibium sp. TaxID=1936171 RepID=UPI00261700C0|nr:type VI secretion system-associated FHA domain protein TagH [uncultured Roseibium sp.]